MNAKISLFVACVEAIIFVLLHGLDDCNFNVNLCLLIFSTYLFKTLCIVSHVLLSWCDSLALASWDIIYYWIKIKLKTEWNIWSLRTILPSSVVEPDRIRGICRNGGIRGIFQPPRYHLRKVILGLDKYLKSLWKWLI